MRLLINDSDTVVYRIALRMQDDTFDIDPDFPVEFSEEDYERAYQDILDEMKEMLFESGCLQYRFYLTGKENFRYNFLPSYKFRRGDKPIAFEQLKQMCLDRMPECIMIDGEEADDSCTRDFTTEEIIPYDAILCDETEEEYLVNPMKYIKVLGHIDKDLDQVAGEHFNYGRGDNYGTYFVSKEVADAWAWYQALAGDSADCYKGCPMVGGEISKTSKAGATMTKQERILGSKAMKIAMGTLCVRPYKHWYTKGKKIGTFDLKWEEYHDASLTREQRIFTWFIKGYCDLGRNYGGRGHVKGFDTVSGFEEHICIYPHFNDLGCVLGAEDKAFLKREMEIQYNIAYMLRCGEEIPTEMKQFDV